MKIGELATQHGISADTIRFYEKQQLLTPGNRSAAGYRLYDADDCQRLGFILRAKAVGFSLQQIRELLTIEDNKAQWRCDDVKQKVQQKLLDIEQQIAELQSFHKALTTLDTACDGGSASADRCSILASLETGKPSAGGHHD